MKLGSDGEEFQSEHLAWGLSEYLLYFRYKYKSSFKNEVQRYRERIYHEEHGRIIELEPHRLSSTKMHSTHELTRRNINTVRNFQKKCGVVGDQRMSSYGKSKKDLDVIGRTFAVGEWPRLPNIDKGRRVTSVEQSLDVYFKNKHLLELMCQNNAGLNTVVKKSLLNSSTDPLLRTVDPLISMFLRCGIDGAKLTKKQNMISQSCCLLDIGSRSHSNNTQVILFFILSITYL